MLPPGFKASGWPLPCFGLFLGRPISRVLFFFYLASPVLPVNKSYLFCVFFSPSSSAGCLLLVVFCLVHRSCAPLRARGHVSVRCSLHFLVLSPFVLLLSATLREVVFPCSSITNILYFRISSRTMKSYFIVLES